MLNATSLLVRTNILIQSIVSLSIKELTSHPHSSTMTHAASMPTEFGSGHQIQGSSLLYSPINPLKSRCAQSVDQINGMIQHNRERHSALGVPYNITQVDMSNDYVFAIAISEWKLHPSVINHSMLNDNLHVSNEDLLELVSVILRQELI